MKVVVQHLGVCRIKMTGLLCFVFNLRYKGEAQVSPAKYMESGTGTQKQELRVTSHRIYRARIKQIKKSQVDKNQEYVIEAKGRVFNNVMCQ